MQHGAPRSGKILQLGGLYDPPETDPARLVLKKYGLQGMVAGAALLEGEIEPGWQQGPLLDEIEVSVEGGVDLFKTLQDSNWDNVDVVRLEDIAGGCLFLRGLLSAGLKTGMLVMIVNGQFPLPLRFASMATDAGDVRPEALYSCSLSFALDVLRPHGFHLVRYSGPYAAFLHENRLPSTLGPRNPNEFECFRGARIWGFKQAFPIEFVRELFFSSERVEHLWQRCWEKAASLLTSKVNKAGTSLLNSAPKFLLYY